LNNRVFWSVLGIILIISLGIRLWSLNHGLPNIQVTDENSDLSTALRLTEGEIPNREVRYHRSLIAYVNVASIGGLFGYSYLTDKADSLTDFRDLYFADRALFTQATRLTFALLATLTTLFVALAGRYINEWVGLLGAGILTVNGFFALNAVYALPDALVTIAIAICLWLTMRVWKFRRNRDYFLAGLSIALVMLSKFNGVTVGIGLVIAHIAIVRESKPDGWLALVRQICFSRRVLWLIIGIVIGNLVLNPIPFLYPEDLIFEIRRLNGYAYGSPITLIQRFQIIVEHIIGITPLAWRFMLPASLFGLAAALRYHRFIPYWIVVGAFLLLMITIANVTTIFYKPFFWTPWLIPMALLSAIGLDALRQWFIPRKLQVVAYAAIVSLLTLEAYFMLNLLHKQIVPDTRQIALTYVQENLPANTRIISGDPIVYAVPMQRSQISIERAIELGEPSLRSWDWWLALPEAERPNPAYDLYGPEMQAQIDSYQAMQQLIADEQIEYIIDTEYCAGTINRPEADNVEEYPAINDAMRDEWELVAVFSPFEVDTCISPIDPRTGLALNHADALAQQPRSGPMIRIYRIPTGETTPG